MPLEIHSLKLERLHAFRELDIEDLGRFRRPFRWIKSCAPWRSIPGHLALTHMGRISP